MKHPFISDYEIAYIEIYTPMAKALAYWHEQALGFSRIAGCNMPESNVSSFLLRSNTVNLLLTSAYPTKNITLRNDITAYTEKNYCGVKRIALKTNNVTETFRYALKNGAIPVSSPHILEDEYGSFEQAGIKLYDDNEIIFINNEMYNGVFKPGYTREENVAEHTAHFTAIDHVAAELRVNEINFWTNYISDTIGTTLIQTIERGPDNATGMQLNISQSFDKKLTLVMAEPDAEKEHAKIQENIDRFGPGIHHIAFATDNMINTLDRLQQHHVEFVNFPPAYYEILREDETMKDMDIDLLEKYGILIDKEGDTYLLQKFIKPITERPYFFYEIVQRVKGYNGFALKNINVLKKAEERQIMKVENQSS